MNVDLNLAYDESGDPDVLAARLRNHRNRLLSESDWTQLDDAPVDRDAWKIYRQALRDLPAAWKPGPTVTLPEEPS